MKISAVIIISFLFVFISASCSNSEDVGGLSHANEPQALLFTDENTEDIERQYYEALIDFQHENDEQTDVTIVRENEPSVADYDIEEYPTLILIKCDQSDTSISGEHTTEEIKTLLQKHFSE
ncbi:hypothetical protein [Natribacillus halophilus]|uniref:Thioredoxin n=1 Tax=Natribacillus halophilus TaxID=549003 RepID=A0A1G8MBJ8_9BACI|nr:hypothetical protein [Natribacillus halophilus]SDI65235.1 Thioredoxin [Natribacillus halophilus]